MAASRVILRSPLLLFQVLACLIGWVFVLAKAFGANLDAGQLPLGPIVAAAIVAALMGRDQLRLWGRRLVAVRASPGWYLFAFLAPAGILVAAVLLNAAFGAPLPTRAQLGEWTSLVPTFFVILLLIGVGEEAGWTAFAAPLLLERHRQVVAWLILATMRTLWHVPLMLQGDLDLTKGLVGNFAFQFLVLWLYRRTGVWLLAAIWHATLNTVGGQFLFRMVSGADQDRLSILMVGGYVVLAIVVWFLERRRPGLASMPSPAAPGAPDRV